MAKRPALVRKADLERIGEWLRAGGHTVARVEIEAEKIIIHTSEGEAKESPLDAWRRQNGAS